MIISTFRSVGRAYVDHAIDMPWPAIADLLTTHIDSDSKESTPMFNLVEFKSESDPTVELGRRYHKEFVDGAWVRSRDGTYEELPGTVRRCKNNVVALTGIVLDIDENYTIKAAMSLLQGIEFVLYTTFRHTQQQNKFRIVIPFSQPLLAADIAGRQAAIVETFPGVDSASFTVSQSFYFHSGPGPAEAYWNEGVMVDPYAFEYRAPPTPTAAERVSEMEPQAQSAYKSAVVASLNTCSGLHRNPRPGRSNHAVLTLVSLCRSVGMTFDEFNVICARMAHPESKLRNPAERWRAWSTWSGDRLRKETRDAFISAYGGVPVKLDKTVLHFEYQQKIAEVEQLEKLLKELS